MELKKHPLANLENKRKMFFQVGLVFAFSITLIAFEWMTYYEIGTVLPGETVEIYTEEENVPIVVLKEEKPEVKTEKPKRLNKNLMTAVKTEIKVVDNQTPVNEDNNVPDLPDLNLPPVEFTPEIADNRDPFAPIEEMPSYPGGETALFGFLGKHLKYPEIPRKEGIDGTVFVEFIVDENGNLTSVKIAKGVNPYLDREALRVIKLMPRWQRGRQRGMAVPAGLRIPIRFTLNKGLR